MTVTVAAGRSVWYNADGVARRWSFPFRALSAGQLYLEVMDPQGAVNEVMAGFSLVDLYALGGVVEYPIGAAAALPTGYKVRVARRVAFEQPARIGNQGAFHAQTHEQALDLLAMQIQQINENGTAGGLAAPFDDLPVDMRLPTATARAGKILEFDSLGRPFVSTSVAAMLAAFKANLDAVVAMLQGWVSAATSSALAAMTNLLNDARAARDRAVAAESSAAYYAVLVGNALYDFNLPGATGDEDWNEAP